MREIRPSGSEGGGTLIGSPYPYPMALPFREHGTVKPFRVALVEPAAYLSGS
jgi:hypothetical protein